MSPDLFSTLGQWLICAIGAERVTEVITTSVLFAPLREAIGRLAHPEDVGPEISKPVPFFAFISKLISCSWCTSFWVCGLFALFLPGAWVGSTSGDFWPIKAAALVGFTNLFHSIFQLVYRGRIQYHEVTLVRNKPSETLEIDEFADEH